MFNLMEKLIRDWHQRQLYYWCELVEKPALIQISNVDLLSLKQGLWKHSSPVWHSTVEFRLVVSVENLFLVSAAFYFSNLWKQQCFRRRLTLASVVIWYRCQNEKFTLSEILGVCSTSACCVEGMSYHWNANIFRRQASAWSCWQTNFSIDSQGIFAKETVKREKREKVMEKWQSSEKRWKRFHLSSLHRLTVDFVFKVQFDFQVITKH